MLKNKQQAKIVKAEIDGLKKLVADMEDINATNKLDLKQKMQYNIFKSRIEELDSEVEEYEFLTSKEPKVVEFTSNDLQKAIIGFRIASGLTQGELAEMLEIAEQQIQRYEQNDYLTASFERIIQILQTLGVEINLKKEFLKEAKVININDFMIPEGDRNQIFSKTKEVAERHQLIVINR
jgi:transcriptional regulator with XRE-family HTH domain